MQLTVDERFQLLAILPPAGNYLTLKVIHDLRMALAHSEEEQKRWGFVEHPDTQTLTWDLTIPQEAEIPIGERGTEIIKKELMALNNNEKLNDRQVSIYEKFIIGAT